MTRTTLRYHVTHPDLTPLQGTPGSAGLDLRAAEDVIIYCGQRHLVPTGFRCAIEPGYEGQLRMRSGLAVDKGAMLVNGVGTIDSDYRGEVKVPIYNSSNIEPIKIERGQRIAQLVLSPVPTVDALEVDDVAELGTTERGSGGFGSTGVA